MENIAHGRVGRRYVTSRLLPGTRCKNIYATARFAYERKWDSKCQLGGFIPRRTMRKLYKSELSSRIDFSNIDLAYADANYYKRSRQSGEICKLRDMVVNIIAYFIRSMLLISCDGLNNLFVNRVMY